MAEEVRYWVSESSECAQQRIVLGRESDGDVKAVVAAWIAAAVGDAHPVF